jgi:hypothetical protein
VRGAAPVECPRPLPFAFTERICLSLIKGDILNFRPDSPDRHVPDPAGAISPNCPCIHNQQRKDRFDPIAVNPVTIRDKNEIDDDSRLECLRVIHLP